MAVPISLPNGTILIYGWGISRNGSEGFVTPDNINFVFGNIYQVWDGGASFVYGGDQVMWKDGSEVCKLAYSGQPYTLIQAKLVTKQSIVM